MDWKFQQTVHAPILELILEIPLLKPKFRRDRMQTYITDEHMHIDEILQKSCPYGCTYGCIKILAWYFPNA